jgi:tripartite-type tricarboxylate transporter receptor subunit TctC
MDWGAKKIQIVSGILGIALFLCSAVDIIYAKDPDYPTKPITCYIPYGPGGNTDLAARALMEAAAKYLGQKIIPVNRSGAGGTLAATTVMSSKPDGYTLGVVPTSAVFMAPFSEDTPYKDLSGFTMIMNFTHYIYLLAVKDDAPWKTWKEFIGWAKKNPRAAKVGIIGTKTNSSTGLFLWEIEKREQVEITDIPLKSSHEVLTAFLGGHTNMYFSTIDASTMEYIKGGKLQIVLYAGELKVPGYESVPTAQELYGFSIPNLVGMFAPKGLPENVLLKLDEAFGKAIKDPDFVNSMNRMYMPIVYQNRVQMNKYVDKTFKEMADIFKTLKSETTKTKK